MEDFFKLPFFGVVNIKKVDEYYVKKFRLNGQLIKIDLNFEKNTTTKASLQRVENFIKKIPELHKKSLAFIKDDYKNGEEVKYYIDQWLFELDDSILDDLLFFENKEISKGEQLLSTIYLKRIGLYPEKEKIFGILDYTITEEEIDELVVVFMNPIGEIIDFGLES